MKRAFLPTIAGWTAAAALLFNGEVPARVWAEEMPPKINYDEHVKPIFRDNCFACHAQDDAKSDLALDSYGSLVRGGASGAVVVPGDVEGSRLWKLISHQESPEMPPEQDKLGDELLAVVRQWIEQGALENAGSVAVVKKKPKISFSGATGAGRPEGAPPMPENLSRRATVYASHGTPITAMAASPWAPLVAVASQAQVLLYQSDTGELLGVLPFPEGTAYVLRFSRNGGLLLAGGGHAGKSGRVVVFDVRTGARVFEVGEEIDAVLAADINEDHTQIALGGPSKVVRCFSTADGSLMYELRKHTDWIYALEFSPDGVLLATADRNGGLFVWEAETAREYLNLRGHEGAVNEVAWRDDSNVLASASEDGTIRLWEMEQGQQIKSWGAHGGGVQSVRFAHDGRLVSTGRDRVSKMWNADGAIAREFEALPDVGLESAITHDMSRVLAGDWSGEIRAWNSTDGTRLATLSANPPSLDVLAETLTAQLATAEQTANSSASESAALAEQLAASATATEQTAADAAQKAALAASALELKNTADTVLAERAKALEAAAAALAAATEAVKRATGDRDAAAKLLEAQVAAQAAADAAVAAAKTASEQATANRAALEKAMAAKKVAAEEATRRAAELRQSLERIAAEQAAAATNQVTTSSADETASAQVAAP